jgi:hypothetical protein
MAERRERGAAFLRWILYAYGDRLTEEGQQVVARELGACLAGAASTLPVSFPSIRHMAAAGADLQGKVFYWLDNRGPTQGVANYLVNAVPLPADRILSRMIPLGNKAAARQVANAALPSLRISVFPRFVLASASGHSDAQLVDASALLERYLDFFVANYGMRAPRSYMFVYLVPTVDQLRTLAERHHGMRLSYGTIAYSFRDDLSVAAVIPSGSYGSLFHELFHLLARSNFGDIPTWLDEGIAALYEVSRAKDGGFAGTPNWRGDVLARFKDQIPPLADMIARPDPTMSDADDLLSHRREYETMISVQRHAIFAATARYFALYLQQQGKLFDTYGRLRDFSSSDDFTGKAEDVIRIVEQTAGTPIDDLNARFRVWLGRQHNTLRNVPESGGPLDKYLPPAPAR